VVADRRDLRRRLFTLAAGQGGYFSAAQAKAVGYSYQAQAHHVAVGTWRRVDRGIFRLTEWVPGLHDELAKWAVWSRGQGVVSHETALSVHEIGEFESPFVHLTVPLDFARKHGAVRLHHAELPDTDVIDHAGFRITTPLRTLIDVAAAGIDEDQLARAIVDARGRGLFTVRQLRSRAEAIDLKAALRIERVTST
jgi:predicted transcriptional regulator of viral defense system